MQQAQASNDEYHLLPAREEYRQIVHQTLGCCLYFCGEGVALISQKNPNSVNAPANIGEAMTEFN